MKNKNYLKNAFILLIALIAINCNSQINPSYKIMYITNRQYLEQLKNSIFNKQDTSLKKDFENKNGVVIKTKLKNITFNNNTSVDDDNDSYKKYEYLYLIKNHNKHLVKYTYFDGDDFLLIDDKTSKIDTLSGKPIIVNNNLLTISQDMEDADKFSTLKFYQFNSENKLELINIKKEKWIINKITYLKDNKVIFIVNSIEDNKDKYCLLEFKNQ